MGPGTRSRRLAAVATVAVALAGAACSSSPGSGAGPSTVPSPSKSASEIRGAFHTLFDLADPALAPKIAAVQDGSSIKAAISHAIDSSLAKKAGGATISQVSIEHGSACRSESLPSPCALVTYSIVSPSGKPLLPNSKGFAVYLAPKWYVSKETICTLLTFANGNTAPAGC